MTDPQAPLGALKNIGPASAGWLAEIGVNTVGDLVERGPVGVFHALKARRPEVNVVMLYALVGGLMGLHWNELPPAIKAELRALAKGEPS